MLRPLEHSMLSLKGTEVTQINLNVLNFIKKYSLLHHKPKSTFQYLQQVSKTFSMFWFQQTRPQTYYIHTLKQELSAEEKSIIVNDHCSHLPIKISVNVNITKINFLRCIGYLGVVKPRLKHDLLQLKFMYYY